MGKKESPIYNKHLRELEKKIKKIYFAEKEIS